MNNSRVRRAVGGIDQGRVAGVFVDLAKIEWRMKKKGKRIESSH